MDDPNSNEADDLRIVEVPPLASFPVTGKLLNEGRTRLFQLVRDGELERVKHGRKSSITGRSIIRRIRKVMAGQAEG